MIFDIPFK